MLFTLIDGKILSMTVGTSNKRCPVCFVPPTLMNNYEHYLAEKDQIKKENLMHGMSDLHMKIHVLEFLLHLSYKSVLPEGKHQTRGDENKQNVDARKKVIKDRLRTEMNLIVDTPIAGGGGNTNTGNVARTAVIEQPAKFAECLEIEFDLVNNLRILLIAISCKFPINPIKFDELCKKTLEIYMAKYSKFPLPPTIHKLLFHGADIIASVDIPITFLSEEGAESKNKFTRRHKEERARKDTPEHTMEDIFKRAMAESDIIISSIIKSRVHRKKPKELPVEVKELLILPPADDSDTEDDV